MNPDESMFTTFMRSGPLQFFIALLLICIAVLHLTLSLRILAGRRAPITGAFHAVLLFSGPCLVVLLVLAFLPTTLPIFLAGIDAHEPIRHSLSQTAFFGGLCLFTFVPNLLLAIIALIRSERIA